MRLCAASVFLCTTVGLSPAASGNVPAEKLIAFDGQPGDWFGYAVAVQGDLVVVGAPEGRVPHVGAAYIIELTAAGELVRLPHDNSASDQWFGSAVDVEGDLVVVGANHDDEMGPDAGAVYIYDVSDPQAPTRLSKFFAADAGAEEYFGYSVAISGNIVAVGSRMDHSAASDPGAVYLFDISNPVEPVQLSRIPGPDPGSDDHFGFSLACSGDILVVGAPGSSGNTGMAYTYDIADPENPQPLQLLPPENGHSEDYFGFSLSCHGTLVVVGAYHDDQFAHDAGAAYMFDALTGQQLAKFAPDDVTAYKDFGVSVAVSNGIAIVGAWQDCEVATMSGAAYAFDVSDPQNPQQIHKLIPDDLTSDNYFGWAAAIDDGIAVVGAFEADYPGEEAGAAYLFAFNSAPTCEVDLTYMEENFFQPSSGSFVVTEGETIIVPFTGEDADDDDLAAALTGLPAEGSLDVDYGPSPLVTTLQWTPTAADKAGGPYEATVSFTDPSDASSSCWFIIEDINLRPICDAGGDVFVEAEGPDGTLVTLQGDATDPDDDDATLEYQWYVPGVVLDDPTSPTPTGMFPIGVTTATLVASDPRGGISVPGCTVQVHVADTTPPEVVCVAQPSSLWPPNHRMKDIEITVSATDACDDPEFIFALQITVRSDEPDDAAGDGDGNTTGDVNGQDGYAAPVDVLSDMEWDEDLKAYVGTIQLRAERAGTGDGRMYTIDVVAIDSHLNEALTSCCVVVPHSRKHGGG